MRKNALAPTDEELEYGDYLHDERREQRAEEQAEMFEKPLEPDAYVILQLFINWRGIDIPQDFEDLCHVYHSVHTDPNKLPKTSWSRARVLRAVEQCQAAGLVIYREHHDGHKYELTKQGLEARKAEYERRVRR